MIKQLTENVYYMPHDDTTDRPTLGLVCGSKHSLIIDSGNSPNHAKEFLSKIKSMDIPPVKYLVITHHHWDHIFGIEEMDYVTITSQETEKKIGKMRLLKWDDQSLKEYIRNGRFNDFTVKCIKEEIPNRENFKIGDLDLIYEEKITIDLGDLKCIVELIGGSHTDDSAIVYIPQEKVLFLGDCIYGRRYNSVYGYKKENLMPMIQKIEKYPADHYMMSHMAHYDQYQINKLWDELKLAERIVGDEISTEKCLEKYTHEIGSSPSEDLSFYIKCFAEVNEALLKNN